MKRPSNTDSRLEDDDMASLFAAQKVDVPKDLKQSVFVQAERKLLMDAAVDFNDAVTDDHSAHNSDLHGNVIAGERTQQHRLHSRSRWLAVAATMLMAVAVAPLLLNTPDSSLKSDGVASYDIDPTAPSATPQPTVLTRHAMTEKPAALTVPVNVSDELAETEVTVSNAPAAAPLDAEQTINNDQLMSARKLLSDTETLKQQASDDATGGVAGDTAGVTVSNSNMTPYRRTAIQWIEEIQRLIDRQENTRAQSEYLLFKRQHPDSAKNFKPDFEAVEK